jgi:protein-disulfide isomerase
VPTVESLETLIAEEKAKAEKFVAAHGGKRGPGLYDEMRTTSEHTDTRGNVIVGWRGLDRAKAVEAGEPVGGRADAVAVDVDTEGLPVKGDPKKAKVTIVECSDFDCPYCKRALDTLAQIEKAYGVKVALYFRQNPLPMHQNAMPAHKAAVAAHAQCKFWAMHDKLFENQSARTEDEFVAFAKELGLDVDKFRKAYNDPETEATIKRDLDVCSKMGVSGVPAFFIDGQPIRGAQPFDNFKPLIDRALAGQVG